MKYWLLSCLSLCRQDSTDPRHLEAAETKKSVRSTTQALTVAPRPQLSAEQADPSFSPGRERARPRIQ